MVTTRNRKEKPRLTPPQGELPLKSTHPLVTTLIVISLLALLILTAIVIWLLPPKAPLLLDQTLVPQAGITNNMDTSQPATAPQDSEAEQLLEAWLKSQAAAEADNIPAWGGEAYAEILKSAVQADQFFQRGEFSSAKTLYKKAIQSLTLLLASKEEMLRGAIIQRGEALENEEIPKALSAFQQALLIDAQNEEALHGVRRASTLNHVLALYREGLRLETENDLEQAQQLLREAGETDKDFAPAAAALKRVDKKRQDLSFQDAMSRAIAALVNGQLSVADKALERAAQLRPRDPAMTAARQRSAEMHTIQKLKNLQIKADELVSLENWEGVVETYSKAIQIDNTIGFATIGMPEAKKRLQLDKSLKSIIARPDRLQDEGPLGEARKILKNAQRVITPGKILHFQIGTVTGLVQNASTTVDVVLRSDNATEVEIYHIGRFPPFLEKPLTLRPGTYTVVGRKAGFKDVRLSIKIKADMKTALFFVRCEEPI